MKKGFLIWASGSAQMTLNVGLPTAPQFTGEFSGQGTTGFILNFSGSPEATYNVWTSTNLLNWSPLGSATETGSGQYQFVDATMTNSPQRFYRASAP